MASVPGELLKSPHWVVWQYEQKGKDDKPTKVPYCAMTGHKASSTNGDTWVRFGDAMHATRKKDGLGFVWDGLGYVVTKDDKLTGIDLDHCRDAATGVIEQWAQAIIDAMHSYTEVTPSGEGVRIWIHANLPGTGKRRGDIEIYDNGRFFTVTGQHLEGTPDEINEAQGALNQMLAGLFPEREERTRGEVSGSALDDDTIILKAGHAKNSAKFNALWSGDASGYSNDPSKADLALCGILAFWTGGDKDQIDRLFRQSGLMRDKWDERRGYATYGERSIDATLATLGEVYEPRTQPATNGHAKITPIRPDTQEGNTQADAAFTQVTPAPTKAPLRGPYEFTEFGNMQRMLDCYGANMRYNPSFGWVAWDGRRWQVDSELSVRAWAKQAVKAIYDEAARLATRASASEDEAEQAELGKGAEKLLKWARASQTNHMVTAMVALARDGCLLPPEEFDSQPFLLTVLNGTIDLRTGERREHRQEDYITQLAPVEYDPSADAPRWLAFLDEIMLGRNELIDYLRRSFGYCLTGSVKEQVWYLCFGEHGDNGKSTMLEVLMAVLGDYAGQIPAEALTIAGVRQDSDAPTPTIAGLKGKRLVVSSETEDGARLAAARIKKLSGRDTLSGRFMRKDPFSFYPTAKIVIHTNHKPQARETTHAFWRRVRYVPFDFTLMGKPKEAKDLDLPDKLAEEAAGILAWLVAGCLEWQQRGLDEPEAILQATQDYRDESDILKTFLDERTERGEHLKIALAALYQNYQAWCVEAGEKEMAQRRFGQAIRARGFEQLKGFGPTGAAGFKGIALKSAMGQE